MDALFSRILGLSIVPLNQHLLPLGSRHNRQLIYVPTRIQRYSFEQRSEMSQPALDRFGPEKICIVATVEPRSSMRIGDIQIKVETAKSFSIRQNFRFEAWKFE